MLTKNLIKFLLAVLGVGCLAVPVPAQNSKPSGGDAGVFLPPGGTDTGLGGGNAITGTILVNNGQRIHSHVSVRLQTMTKGDRLAVTDDNGSFAFKQLPNGDYTIVIDKEKEYEPFRAAVEIRQFGGAPPQAYSLSIRLEPKAGAVVKTGVLNAELANVPAKWVHKPWAAPGLLREGYPEPIVEHDAARRRALAAYEKL